MVKLREWCLLTCCYEGIVEMGCFWISVQYHLLFLSSLEYFPKTGPSFRHPGHLQSICLQTHPGAKGGRRVKEGWKMGSNSNNFEMFFTSDHSRDLEN